MMKAKNIFLLKTRVHSFVLLVFMMLVSAPQMSAQTLAELKQISAEQNLELKAQYKQFEARLEQVNQAKAWQDPNLSFGYFISPIETRVGPQVARLSLTQMFPWFGTYKVKGDIAAFQAEAEFQKFQDTKLKLFVEVSRQYYDLMAITYQIELEQLQLSNLEDIRTIVQSQYENNKAQLIDVYRVDLDIDKQRNALKVLDRQNAALTARLNQLLNRNTSVAIVIENPKKVLEGIQMLSIDSISSQHPRLKRLESIKASANKNVILAEKQNKPQFGVGLDYAFIQNSNVQNADAGQDAIMPMLSMSLPIFGKKNKSRKKVAALEEASVKLALENEALEIHTELEIAYFKRQELMDVLDLYETQLKDLNDMIRLSESALANTQISVEELLDLQNERLMIEKLRVKTLAELHKNQQLIIYLTQNGQQ